MTTVIPFLPSNISAPQIAVTLDGNDYNMVVTWNVSGARYYINLYDLNGNWIVTCPIITSPPAEDVADFEFDALSRTVTVTKASNPQTNYPLYRRAGTMIKYWLTNFQPTTFNGFYPNCLTISPAQFTFLSPSDPGSPVVMGKVEQRLNIVAGIFQTSTMIYRNGAFEIDP